MTLYQSQQWQQHFQQEAPFYYVLTCLQSTQELGGQILVDKKELLYLAIIFDQNTDNYIKKQVLFDTLKGTGCQNQKSDDIIMRSHILTSSCFERYLLIAANESILFTLLDNPHKLCDYYSCVQEDQKKEIVKLMTYYESSPLTTSVLGIVNTLFENEAQTITRTQFMDRFQDLHNTSDCDLSLNLSWLFDPIEIKFIFC